jgi:hypothetical protein
MRKNIHSRMSTAISNSPNKLADLNDGIQRQLMQLHLKFAQNFQKDWVGRYAKTSNKEILEHNRLVSKSTEQNFQES